MNQQEKRIKLGQFFGWNYRETSFLEKILLLGCKYITVDPKGHEFCGFCFPDYFNDLNVIYEAEEHLDRPQALNYFETIIDLNSKILKNTNRGNLWEDIHCSSETKAEALGITLGLWR